MAHEINQPLAAILSYARGCERRIDNGSDLDGVREAVRHIAVQAERAGDIVRRMREFVRKNPSKQVPIDPAAAFRDALALFEPTATRGRPCRSRPIFPTELPLVRADRLQIEEIILNLLQNALEAVAGQADREIRLKAEVVEGIVKVSVSDNGPGLSPAARDHLFEAFFTTKADGLGLGLSLSRTIVEAHGGRLEVDVERAGNDDLLVLPSLDGGIRACLRSGRSSISSTTIRRFGTRWAFSSRRWDIEFVACASGQELLAKLDDRRPSCVVLDVRLPGVSGLELQRELQKRETPASDHFHHRARRHTQGRARDAVRRDRLPGEAVRRPAPARSHRRRPRCERKRARQPREEKPARTPSRRPHRAGRRRSWR